MAVGGDFNQYVLPRAESLGGIEAAAAELVGQHKEAEESLQNQDPPGDFRVAGEFEGWLERISRAFDRYDYERLNLPPREAAFHRKIANVMQDRLNALRSPSFPHNESRGDHLIHRTAKSIAELERWLQDRL